MWIKKVSQKDHIHVARAVVQITRKGTYLTVQDRYGAILGSAKWPHKITYRQAEEFLRAEKLPKQGQWQKPRDGVLFVEVRRPES